MTTAAFLDCLQLLGRYPAAAAAAAHVPHVGSCTGNEAGDGRVHLLSNKGAAFAGFGAVHRTAPLLWSVAGHSSE
eukprot:1154870-Pelagomonas_calceolata.AAC.2